MPKSKTWWKFVIAGVLILLVVRALELRLPGITSSMNEDEIHHNYWLLEYNSAFGDYIVWQLQPLLDYHLRLYVWFPLLSLSAPTWGFIALFALPPGLLALTALRAKTKRDKKGAPRFIKYYFAFSAWIALWGLVVQWLRFTELGFGFSLRSWLVLILSGSIFVVFSFSAYRAWCRSSKGFDRILRSHRVLAAVFGTALILFLVTSAAFFGRLYGALFLSAQVSTYLEILSPFLCELSFLAFLILALVLVVFNVRYKKVLLGFLGVIALLWIAFAIKPLAHHTNYSEWLLKIPNLIFGLSTLIISFFLAYRYLTAKLYPRAAVLVIALLGTLWLVYNPLVIEMDMYARHYSFAILTSVLWMWAFVVSGNGRTPMFWVLSFLLLNGHFFGILLVLAAYSYYAINSFVGRDLRSGLRILGGGVSVVIAALLVNYPVAYFVLSIGSDPVLSNLKKGFAVVENYFRVLGLPISPLPTGVAIAGAVLLIGLLVLPLKDQTQRRLAFLTIVLLPILVYYGSRPDYGFRNRYFSLFLGLGFVVMTLAIERGYQLITAKIELRNAVFRWASIAILLVGVLPFLVFTILDFPVGLVTNLDNLKMPPSNQSPFYQTYSQLKNQSERILIFYYSPIAIRRDIPNFYLDYVDGYSGDYELLNAFTSPEIARTNTEFFIQTYSNSVVVFDGLIGSNCPSGLPSGNWSASIEKLEACVWVIRDLSSYEEMCTIANALDFPADEGPNMCREL